MSDSPLAAIAAELDAIAIPYMVVGSFASMLHGEPRTTQDLDLVIDPTVEQLDALLARLDPAKYYFDRDVALDALSRRSMFNVIDIGTAWKIDLVIRKDRAFSIEELQRRRVVVMMGVRVAAATAEDTIVAKLEWAKQGASTRQLVDVAGILRVRRESLDLTYLQRWVEALDLADEWARARALVT
ncbi:MAG TPA: hypothetical protein VGG28_01485 [Kofleriaceae bacterium]|jgi:hypothetical protein